MLLEGFTDRAQMVCRVNLILYREGKQPRKGGCLPRNSKVGAMWSIKVTHHEAEMVT